MKTVSVEWFSLDYEFPVRAEPRWKGFVQRWYQLDASAYGLCEGYTQWGPSLRIPSLIILASPTASNETDKNFIEKGAVSPAVFAHTLANVRASPLCQVMNWSGSIICLQKDPETLICGLKEAYEFLCYNTPVIWLLSVFKEKANYQAHCFQLTESTQISSLEMTKESQPNKERCDYEFLSWLNQKSPRVHTFEWDAYVLKRSRRGVL